MSILENHYPMFKIINQTTQIKEKLKKIPLETPKEKISFNKTPLPTITNNPLQDQINKYQTLTENIQKAYQKHPRNKELIRAVIYIQTLQPLNKSIQENNNTETQEYLTELQQEINKLINTYQDYLTQDEDNLYFDEEEY